MPSPTLPRVPLNVVLFLPGSIDTGATPYIGQGLRKERLAAYKRSLGRWLDAKLGIRIVFSENSGADLDPLREIAASRGSSPDEVVFHSFTENEGAFARGKGAGELATFRRALEEVQEMQA